MMNNYLIYRIINPSGKIYLGVTNSYKRRMSEHLSDWKNRPEKIALHNSFTKYGYENHNKEVIFDGLSKIEAYNLEKELIEKYNLRNSKKGLNSRAGGKGGNMIDWKSEKGKFIIDKKNKESFEKYLKDWEKNLPIILKCKDTHTIKEICEILKCSSSALCRYLNIKKINIKRKPKYNLNNIALEIKKYYEIGKTNQYIIDITGYSKGTICRAKKLILDELYAIRKVKQMEG